MYTSTEYLAVAVALLLAGHAIYEMEVVDCGDPSLVAVRLSERPTVPIDRRPKSREVALYLLARHWVEHFWGPECQFEDGILMADGCVRERASGRCA